MKKTNTPKTRRDFLILGARTLGCGGLLFLSAVLGARSIFFTDHTPTCPTDLPCRDCNELRRCRDSRALQLKHEQKTATPGGAL